MHVLFGKNLTVFYGLDRSVEVVLVDLSVDSGGSLFMTLLDDLLLYDGWGNFLMNGGIMVSSLGPRILCQ